MSNDFAAATEVSDLRTGWDALGAAATDARQLIEGTERFRNRPEERARAYASLMEAQAWAFNFAVLPRLNAHPQVYWHSTWHANIYGLGQPIGDFRYGGLFLDGARTYRMHGSIGDLKLLLLQVHSHLLGHPDSQEIGNYDFHDFELGADGSFDVVLSAEEHEGNWIQLDPYSDYNFCLIRRIAGDWQDDLGAIDIVEVGPEGSRVRGRQPRDFDMAEAMRLGAGFLHYLINTFVVGLHDIYIARAGGEKNAWAAMPGASVATELVGSRSVTYAPGVFEIGPDEAVIIEWEPPDAAYWSFQLGDIWSRPLDYMNYQTDVNMVRARIDPDGMFRAVISHRDPGVANWLDTTGVTEGTVVERSYRSRGGGIPSMRKVRFADLGESLPSDTQTVSPEERDEALTYRRRAAPAFFHR